MLYHSHFHALELQLKLTHRNIPFTITNKIRFFEQTHVKNITTYLKLTINPQNELSFKHIVRLLPEISGKKADKLWHVFQNEWHKTATLPTPLATTLQQTSKAAPKKTQMQ